MNCPIVGHTTPFSEMTRQQRRKFQHSYSNHREDFHLPTWRQGIAEQLRIKFNYAVTNIKNTVPYWGTTNMPVGNIPTTVHYYQGNIHGKQFYYYETIDGKFVSSGIDTKNLTRENFNQRGSY